jgi:hypothetical protein
MRCLLITSMVAALIALTLVSAADAQFAPPDGGGGRGVQVLPGWFGRPYSAEALRSNSATQAHPPKIGHCDLLCQRKCQATWQAGGLPNVEACYAKWSRLNRTGIARQCEAANRARLAGQPRLPGC